MLLLSVLLAYLESMKNARYRRPILYGVALAIGATVVTYFAVDAIFSALPFGREVLEALVARRRRVLFYLSFWLVARLEQRRWLEFLKARVWTAVSAGSAASLALIGFTSVYREGFETVLFYQARRGRHRGRAGPWIRARPVDRVRRGRRLSRAYDAAPWLGSAARQRTSASVDAVATAVRAHVPHGAFRTAIDRATHAVADTFAINAEPGAG